MCLLLQESFLSIQRRLLISILITVVVPLRTVYAHSDDVAPGNVENTRSDDLHAVIDEINRRHLELGLEIGPLVRSAACNSETEAYPNAPGSLASGP